MKKIICIILDILMFIFLFLAYGPISYFRNLLITTAMTTKSHHYLAYTLYNKSTIEKVLKSNYVIEDDNNSDSDIEFDTVETYDSIYDEQILKRDSNELYKIIPLTGSGYKGNMVVIYDSKRIKLVSSKYLGTRGQTLTTLSKENGAIIGMNASGFVDLDGHGTGGAPTGQVIQDGKLIFTGGSTGHGGGLAGFNSEGVLVLTRDNAYTAIKNGIVDAVEFDMSHYAMARFIKIGHHRVVGEWAVIPVVDFPWIKGIGAAHTDMWVEKVGVGTAKCPNLVNV